MPVAVIIALLLLFAGLPPARAADAEQGRLLFERQCAACHTIGGGDRVGPDLAGVTERRPHEWLASFVTAPEQMIAASDPVAVALYERYNRIVMPNLNLTAEQAEQLLAWLGSTAPAATGPAAPAVSEPLPRPALAAAQGSVLRTFLLIAALIIVVFTAIALSTRQPATVDVHKAYGIRRVLFLLALAAVGTLLFLTLPKAPYARAGSAPARVIYVTARQFDFLFSEQPIVSVDDLGTVTATRNVTLARNEPVEFRVTSLDVNHGFGLYGPERQIVAQTQAMPGYFNRLRFVPAVAGDYQVLCLEYCAAGHHLMQTRLTVN